MSYEEKHNYVSLFTLVVVSIPYLIYIFSRYQAETFTTEGELGFWATAILLMIPVRIVAEIIVTILFAIGGAIITGSDKLDDTRDERDQLINLKSTRNSFYTFAVVMLAAFVATATYKTPIALFSVLILGGTVAELVDIASKAYYYRRGI